MKKFLLASALLVLLQNASAQSCSSLRYKQEVFNTVDITTGIVYGNADPYGVVSSQDLTLDVYEPAGDTLSKRPVIVYAYGGAFLIGLTNQPPIPYYGDFYAKHGYVFVSISYRLGFNTVLAGSPERAVYRAAQDLRAAERHLIQRAAQYRIDTSKIILMGSSAGSITDFHSTYMEYAQAAAFATPIPVLDGENLGGVDSSGNSDFNYGYVNPFAIINQWGAVADTSWIDADERVPVVSFHGDGDNAVRYEYGYPFSYPVFPALYGSKPIHERLDNLGIHNELHTLVGYGHEPELLNLDLRDTILQGSRDFIYPLLVPNTSSIVGVENICVGTAVTYSVTNTEGSKYCWQINGNGTIIVNSGNSIQVIWNDTGTVTVAVKELNYIDAEGEEQSFETHVVSQVVSSFSISTNELEVVFVNNSQYALNYQWSFGDNTFSVDSNPAVKYYSSGGTYETTLVVDNNVCSDTFSVEFTIDSCPVAEITYTVTNQNVFLNTPFTNTTTYNWNFGDGNTATVGFPNVFHQYAYGVYEVVVSVQNHLGCIATDTITLAVINTSVDGNTITSPTVIVFPDQLILNAKDNSTVQLYNSAGVLVIERNFVEQTNLETDDLPSGIYLLKLLNNEYVFTRKLVLR